MIDTITLIIQYCRDVSFLISKFYLVYKRMGKTVTEYDSFASWFGVSRCESSYILMIFSILYKELVGYVEHFSVELDTLQQHINLIRSNHLIIFNYCVK